MGRALLGLLKGLVVGGGLGYALLRLGVTDGLLAYVACALTGALVGLICGRAPWRADTIWTPALKMIFGLGVGAGLYALGHHFIPDGAALHPKLTGLPETLSLGSGIVLAPAIGVLYGLFVEVDDGGTADREREAKERERKQLAE